MKTSHKIAGVLLIISILIIIFGNWAFEMFFKNYLVNQETSHIVTNVNNIVFTLQESESKYISIVNDWAHWDETYKFINDKNNKYVELNLNVQSINVLNLNLMLFFNKDNKVVKKLGYDLENQKFTEAPDNLIKDISLHVQNLQSNKDSTFLIRHNNNTYIIAISKITDSLLKKDENGTLVVGRLIDQKVISSLANATESEITFTNLDEIDSKISAQLKNKQSPDFTAHVSIIDNENETITAYILLPTSENQKNPVIVNMSKTMNIYKDGITNINIIKTVYSLLILIFIIIIFWSIKKYISNPIFKITKYLDSINLSDTNIKKLPITGNDELSIISTAINNMLNKISIQHEELKKSEERLRLAQNIAHIGNWELDLKSQVIWASAEALDIYGIDSPTGEIPFEYAKSISLPKYRTILDNAFKMLITNTGKYEVEFEISKKSNNEIRFVYSRAKLILDEKDQPIKVVGIIHDITERKNYEKKILYNSYRDSLTGLYNRRFIDEKMDLIDSLDNLPLAVIIGDVNGLKLANDVYGHKVGDEVLKKVAEIIKTSCRPHDIIARWGGDEFIILLANTTDKETKEIINNIRNTCASSKVQSTKISIALGYYVKHTTTEDIDTVFKNAEDYMYKHKLIETTSMRGKTINTLLNTLYEKNPKEEAHSRRVSDICANIGTQMGLKENDVNKLKIIGLIHDIGKIALDEHILNKPSKLNDDEWKEIKRHPEIGYRILSSTPEMSDLSDHILKHHEKLDGTGYPNGIGSDDIPLMTRILAVADAYDVMTSARAYKSPISQEEAIKELKRNVGTQFDEEIVNILVNKVLHSNKK